MKTYGKELILDLHSCDASLFTRKDLTQFFKALCGLIDMKPEKLVWWDDLHTLIKDRETEPHLVGTSAVQFIRTSNITIHTLDILKQAYINIFSCKDFNVKEAREFCAVFFRGKIASFHTIWRV